MSGNNTHDDLMTAVRWRVSSFSANNGTCAEVGALPDGRVAVRNSNNRDAGTVILTKAEMSAWLLGAKAGEFDDLAV